MTFYQPSSYGFFYIGGALFTKFTFYAISLENLLKGLMQFYIIF